MSAHPTLDTGPVFVVVGLPRDNTGAEWVYRVDASDDRELRCTLASIIKDAQVNGYSAELAYDFAPGARASATVVLRKVKA